MILIYCRTSLERTGKRMSRKVQLSEILKKLEKSGSVEPYEVYSEIESARTIKNRPVFKTVLKRMEDPEVTQLWVRSQDRLVRNSNDMHFVLEHANQYDVIIHSVAEPLLSGNKAMQELQIHAFAALHQYKRESIQEYQKLAYKQKSEQGLWLNGQVPYGYTYKQGTVSIIETEAVIVKRIYELYLTGKMGYKKIASLLNDEGQHFKGQLFERSHIYLILSNERYTGNIVNRYGVFKGQHEAIISIKTFSKVQEIRKKQAERFSRKQPSTKSKLACICPYCGIRLSCVTKNKVRYYFCSSEQKSAPHKLFYVNAERLEQEVKQQLICWIQKDERLVAVKNTVENQLFSNYQLIEQQLKQLEDEKEILFFNYEKGVMEDEEFIQALAKANKKIYLLEKKRTIFEKQQLKKEELKEMIERNINTQFENSNWISLPEKVFLSKTQISRTS